MEGSDFLKYLDAQCWLGVNLDEMRRIVDGGELSTVWEGGHVGFRRSDLAAWLLSKRDKHLADCRLDREIEAAIDGE